MKSLVLCWHFLLNVDLHIIGDGIFRNVYHYFVSQCIICMRRMVRYMMRYIVRYTESQFPTAELFIMITWYVTAPSNILLMSIINIFPGSKWWWTKQYELRPFIMFTMVLVLCLCLDITMLNTAEMRDMHGDYYHICVATRLCRIKIGPQNERQTHTCKFVKFVCVLSRNVYLHIQLINLSFTSYRWRNVNFICTKFLFRYT